MPQASWRDVMFSIKTFGAAMLALYIAFALDLTQPSWAMLTAFVVSQPIAGMVAAKSLFRVMGTLVGAGMALILVGTLAQAGPLFLVALALWIGACTFTSVFLRDAPAAYGAVLSGYTAAIVGIPAALAPETAFDYASGRCIEIILGIGCATLISQVIFPRTAGEALKASVRSTLGAALAWTSDVLRRERHEDKALADQRIMIADVIALDSLRIYATFDTPSVRAAGDLVRHLQGDLLTLLSILVSVNDRLTLLQRQVPGKAEDLKDILDRTAGLLDRSDMLHRDSRLKTQAEDLRREALSRLPTFDDMVKDHETILVRNILLRIADVLAVWRRLLDLRDALLTGQSVPLPEAAPSPVRYRDATFSLMAGAVSATAVLVTSAFWIVSGWAQGSSAVIFSGVICSILGGQDDPVPSAANFLRMTFFSAVVAALYLFAVLPAIDGFVSLVAALLPFYLPFGVLLGLPRIGVKVTPLGLNMVAFLGLTNVRSQPDFAAFANSSLALLAGIAAGILMFRLLRPLGVDWTIRRIRHGILQDLERLAGAETPVDRNRFASRMFDRVNALFTRLDPSRPDHRDLMRSSLASLRIGFNIILLTAAERELPPDAAAVVGRVRTALQRHFHALRSGASGSGSFQEIDGAVAYLLRHPVPRAEDLLTALVAINSALHRHKDLFGEVRSSLVPDALRQDVPA